MQKKGIEALLADPSNSYYHAQLWFTIAETFDASHFFLSSKALSMQGFLHNHGKYLLAKVISIFLLHLYKYMCLPVIANVFLIFFHNSSDIFDM